MDDLQTVRQQMERYLLVAFFIQNAAVVCLYWYVSTYYAVRPNWLLLVGGLIVAILLSIFTKFIASAYLISPLAAIWQTILCVSLAQDQSVAAPNLNKLHLGHEIVVNLTGQIYQIANLSEYTNARTTQENNNLSHNFIANTLPLPLFVLDPSETIQFANKTAATYLGLDSKDIIGKNVYMVLDMLFSSDITFDKWLKTVKRENATATTSWERVRLKAHEDQPEHLFDLAAYYNRDNPQQAETLLLLFDHTKRYSQDDQAISFMALSVHELRTPLTILRGYIEVFDEELAGKVDPELADFMQKMKATSQELTAFVNNILNVARIDDDQLQLKLQEEDWATVLQKAVEQVSLRAKVRGIAIGCQIAPGLPPVGVDRLSIQEVINNLVDNAVKYSGQSKVITITSQLDANGLIETTIQDFGVGIASNALPNLFTKFYRDHQNRAQVGGTGLGLYLARAIMSAHGGNLWVRSKIGEGSTFGFTILPYAQLAEEIRQNDNKDIVRGAHGWIKNHSLYRR
jgi:signal transduction histidine kinase